MHEPKLGRDAAIKIACALYEANPPAGLAYLTADAYEAMLRNVFATADTLEA
jgi:hypothetical protein